MAPIQKKKIWLKLWHIWLLFCRCWVWSGRNILTAFPQGKSQNHFLK